MTLADIAGWLSLSWETVKTVVQRRLENDYQRIGYRKVHAIAIDELYLGRTRKYITLVIDLESGRIIWVDQGRGSQALREFWLVLSSAEPDSKRWLWTCVGPTQPV